MSAPYPPDFRGCAVELARDLDKNGNQVHTPVAPLARNLKISESGLRTWPAQADGDEGQRGRRCTTAGKELVELRGETA
jgi:transposase